MDDKKWYKVTVIQVLGSAHIREMIFIVLAEDAEFADNGIKTILKDNWLTVDTELVPVQSDNVVFVTSRIV